MEEGSFFIVLLKGRVLSYVMRSYRQEKGSPVSKGFETKSRDSPLG